MERGVGCSHLGWRLQSACCVSGDLSMLTSHTGTLLSIMEGSATLAHTGKVQAFPLLPLGPSVLKVMG